MREPLDLTFDPECDCAGGLVIRREIASHGVLLCKPTLCHCVQSGTPEPRKPCPGCGGLAVKDGFCIGCGAARDQ